MKLLYAAAKAGRCEPPFDRPAILGESGPRFLHFGLQFEFTEVNAAET
jgi:hypothetical protein